MAPPHDLWLVALSVAIAIQGSFVGLSLASGLDTATGLRRRLTLAGSALTLATGIWAMHFVGLLAAQFPSEIDYLALPTLLSFLICVLVVGAGVYAAAALPGPRLRIGVGALAMGLGISIMHYVGMAAVHLAGPIHEEALPAIASVIIAIAASAFALLALGSRPSRTRLFCGAFVLGFAISGMHYSAMAGLRLDPQCYDVAHFVGAESALSRNALALLATFISFGVSATFLLSLIPDPSAAAPAPALAAPAAALAAAPAARGVAPAPAPTRETSAPLTVEKDGRLLQLSVMEIVAVRANAHYTFIHNGDQEFFCAQSIGALEAQLGEGFLRVHRSHLVRLDRITQVRKAGEAWTVQIDGVPQCTIPVARGQHQALKARLKALRGGPAAAFHEMRQLG